MSVLEELRAREPLFHREEHGRTRADFERMTEETFWEVGASGVVYRRDDILDELERRYAAPYDEDWEVHDFAVQQFADDLWLATYTLVQSGTRVTRRVTIWRRAPDGWKAVYHQGTIAQQR